MCIRDSINVDLFVLDWVYSLSAWLRSRYLDDGLDTVDHLPRDCSTRVERT